MILVDVNLLMYAENSASPLHDRAREWWEAQLSGETQVRLAWLTLIAFARLSTSPKAMPNPLTPQAACERIQSWLAQPNVLVATPGPNHFETFSKILRQYSIVGPTVTDAHLAALAIEHNLHLLSADSGFRKFRELKWSNPLATEAA